MKLDQVIIEGFRSYSARTDIKISQFTAFIGKNDVGKTSILAALDAFFNDIIDSQDFTIKNNNTVTIGCVFSEIPEKISLHEKDNIIPEDDKILNSEGNLEIYKKWTLRNDRVYLSSVYIRTYAPSKKEIRNLLQKSKEDLNEIIRDNGIMIKSKKTQEIRRMIYKYFEKKDNVSKDLDVSIHSLTGGYRISPELRMLYRALSRRYFPLYTLFKAEQFREKEGTAISSALEISLKLGLREFDEELSEIYSKVVERVSERTKHALDRIKKDYPNVPLNISPSYNLPDWSKAFSLNELQSDDDVPLEKRGSGLRRIVMLVFFQEEANRERRNRTSDEYQAPVIYAVEEPEISQHPSFQRDIVSALKDLSDSGDQVIITTHAPDLMQLLSEDSIRFVYNASNRITPYVRSVNVHSVNKKNNPLERIYRDLGFQSKVSLEPNAQIAVWVEGITDIWALKNISSVILNAGRFPESLDPNLILYNIIGGYGNFGHKLERDQYRLLKIPQFYIFDSDKSSRCSIGKRVPIELLQEVKKWKSTRRGMPIDYARTRKREMENYIHKEAICSANGGEIDWNIIPDNFDWDFDKIYRDENKKGEMQLWKILKKHGIKFDDIKTPNSSVNLNKPKHLISDPIMRSMTFENIVERCKSTDSKSSEICEVEEWFHKMARLVTEAAAKRGK